MLADWWSSLQQLCACNCLQLASLALTDVWEPKEEGLESEYKVAAPHRLE